VSAPPIPCQHVACIGAPTNIAKKTEATAQSATKPKTSGRIVLVGQ
jgi:hypothetical protein